MSKTAGRGRELPLFPYRRHKIYAAFCCWDKGLGTWLKAGLCFAEVTEAHKTLRIEAVYANSACEQY